MLLKGLNMCHNLSLSAIRNQRLKFILVYPRVHNAHCTLHIAHIEVEIRNLWRLFRFFNDINLCFFDSRYSPVFHHSFYLPISLPSSSLPFSFLFSLFPPTSLPSSYFPTFFLFPFILFIPLPSSYFSSFFLLPFRPPLCSSDTTN